MAFFKIVIDVSEIVKDTRFCLNCNRLFKDLDYNKKTPERTFNHVCPFCGYAEFSNHPNRPIGNISVEEHVKKLIISRKPYIKHLKQYRLSKKWRKIYKRLDEAIWEYPPVMDTVMNATLF